MPRARVTSAALALLALTSAGALHAQGGAAELVLVQGTDSVATERFTRTAERVDATLSLGPMGRLRYTATLAPDASVTRVDLAVLGPAATDTTPLQRGSAVVRGDSIQLESAAADGSPPQTLSLAVPRGAVIYVNPSPSSLEQIVRRARALGGQNVRVPILALGGDATVGSTTVTFGEGGAATIGLGSVQVEVRTDASGAVTGGSIAGQNITIVRRAAQ